LVGPVQAGNCDCESSLLSVQTTTGDIPMKPAILAITIADTDNGARLDLWPVDPSQLISLREHMRWHHLRMSSGECWMLAELPQASDVEVGP